MDSCSPNPPDPPIPTSQLHLPHSQSLNPFRQSFSYHQASHLQSLYHAPPSRYLSSVSRQRNLQRLPLRDGITQGPLRRGFSTLEAVGRVRQCHSVRRFRRTGISLPLSNLALQLVVQGPDRRGRSRPSSRWRRRFNALALPPTKPSHNRDIPRGR